MSERLEQVRRFEDLSAGMIVVVKDCDVCRGGSHREMLLSMEVSATRDPVGDINVEPCFPCIPGAHGLDACIVAHQVNDGHVFRIIDDDLTEVSRQVERKRERVQ